MTNQIQEFVIVVYYKKIGAVNGAQPFYWIRYPLGPVLIYHSVGFLHIPVKTCFILNLLDVFIPLQHLTVYFSLLGSGVNGVEEIKSHPYFSGVNWTWLCSRIN